MIYRVFCPVSHWPLEEGMPLAGGAAITTLPAHVRNKIATWDYCLTGSQVKDLQEAQFWIVRECKNGFVDEEDKAQLGLPVLGGMYALQLIAPIGTRNFIVFSGLDRPESAIDSVNVSHPLISTRWGRAVGFDGARKTELSAVAQGVNTTLHHGSVRLKNALYLFEHGLRASAPYIPLLFWVTALDALMMAGNGNVFEQRLSRFLGPEALVLPPVASIGQPKYRVRDVLGDVYSLRSTIAHGMKVGPRFLAQSGLEMQDGFPTGLPDLASYRYFQLLEECALFLLCSTLRKIFLSNLTETVGNEVEWRRTLGR